MSSPQHCLAKAEEAERLAGIVSYECDKARLRAQAEAWRQMAGAAAPGDAEPSGFAPAFGSRLTRWFTPRQA